MGNKKLKRLLPLIVIGKPTTTLEGAAEYKRVKRKLEKLEKENYFKIDKIVDELEKEIKKSLEKMGLIPI